LCSAALCSTARPRTHRGACLHPAGQRFAQVYPLHTSCYAAPCTSSRSAVPCASEVDMSVEQQLDLGSCGRYLFAILFQMLFITTAFGAIDLACYGPLPGNIELGGPLPWPAVTAIFVGLSLRSRVFSPLDNSRPELGTASISPEADEVLKAKLDAAQGKTIAKELRKECESRGLIIDATMDRVELENRLRLYFADAGARASAGTPDRLMPSWTPPGITFPIMWVLVVAPLRAYSSTLIYEASSGRLNEAHLNDPVLLWLVFHLCIGDTWNTVNNVEYRTGAAVPSVILVWLSTLFAAKQYYYVEPLAGLLLGATAVWITIAGILVVDTWRINDAVQSEPLYPYKRKGYQSKTRLSLESFEGF